MRALSSFLVSLVRLIFGIIEAILGIRILLKLFSANPTAPFVQWIYDFSAPLLYPFRNIFPTTEFAGGYVVEFSAVFALVVYSIIASLIVRFVAMGLTSRERR
ncbi:YggT family protein [Guptibacillus spartinae]|uniref:YggT family protein n=1 Tax=Guptibacillus spartinae TaxID=3025679 RepID=UPI00235F943F|nr:YggT family protein [Pseudalkalibacillus spartinae]